ncbi:MAG: SGNH/GDSL hydrolase family protein [bacterium]|nr:SGNH/GDSL hydrolase family protein [bacterium]
MKKKVIRYALVFAFIGVTLFLLQRLLMPKYVDDVVEGSLISEYYNETTNHDVLFVGDCEVYENFSPIKLWQDYGVTSYIRGSAQQLIWQSYYLLEDALRYEKPKVVVFNVLSMKYDEPQKEAYNRMSLDGMRWSKSKIDAINASMCEEESFMSYVFPLLRYHSRWSEMNANDVKYMFSSKQISHNGYYMRVDTKAAENVPTGKALSNYQFGDNSYKYLDKMVKLCKDNDIQLVLIKAPSLYPYWYEQWDEQMESYAKRNNVQYINFLDCTEEAGIDFNKDTYDGGLHMNLDGAEKLTDYFGKWLTDKYELTDHRNEDEYKSVYEEKIKFYEDMKADQYKEIEEYGKVVSY